MRLDHFKKPGHEKIAIRQFILQMYWFLSMDRSALADFAFDIFHISKFKDGMNHSDLYSMLECIQNKRLNGTSIEDKFNQFDDDISTYKR